MEIKLKIKKLANDGEGLAFYNKKPVFIYNALPGEEVLVDLVKNKRGTYEGNIKKIISKSPDRIEIDFKKEELLGLTLPHYKYGKVLGYKKNKIKHLFETRSKVKNLNVLEIEPSKDFMYYRNEATVRVKNFGKSIGWGLYEKNTNILRRTTKLISQSENLNNLLNKVCLLLTTLNYRAYDKKTKKGSIKGISLRESLKNEFLLTLILQKDVDITRFKDVIKKEIPEIKTFGILINKNPKQKDLLKGEYKLIDGAYFFQLEFNNKKYHITYDSFFQLNYDITLKMINYIKRFNIFKKDHKFLDAYSGVGLFGIELSDMVGEVYAVEKTKNSILALRKTAKENGIKNIKGIVGDVIKWQAKNNDKFNIMLFDPPRSGLGDDVISFIKKQLPDHIIYISCEVETLVNDINKLDSNYEVISVKGFDMFPKTAHVETITLLKLK